MSNVTGYQWQKDAWLINGVEYSGDAMRFLASANGETYVIKRVGNLIQLRRVADKT